MSGGDDQHQPVSSRYWVESENSVYVNSDINIRGASHFGTLVKRDVRNHG